MENSNHNRHEANIKVSKLKYTQTEKKLEIVSVRVIIILIKQQNNKITHNSHKIEFTIQY